MLRASSNLLARLSLNDTKCSNSALSLEFVRWRRKPRWLPVAKSKQFRVPERKKQPEDERAELLRLHNIYKTQLRSVRQYLREEVQRIAETSTADHIVLTAEQEEAEFQHCMNLNAEWNSKIAGEREVRLQKERARRTADIQRRLEAAQIRHEERRERIDEIVRREKELSKTFITHENLDAAIETALANPADYNFAIDMHGNLYRGRNTVPGGSGGAPASREDASEKLVASN